MDTIDQSSNVFNGSSRLTARAYQLEMFEHSMKANTIVVMGTGTGKTYVASLRIDAELRRTPDKQIWFIAPNAGLVDQQLRFLESQLPEYRMRSLTGKDNVDMWGKSSIWNHALKDINTIVATPQVLLDALHNAYVHLQSISLLIFDEAHHCQANSPMALIMQSFYHPHKLSKIVGLPQILGLTASPCISKKTATIQTLEANLDAICRSPTQSLTHYTRHVHKAVLVKRYFTYTDQPTTSLLESLVDIVSQTGPRDDPYYEYLISNIGDMKADEKLKKIQRSGTTPAVSELRRFLGNGQYLHENLGSWASDLYIQTCITIWNDASTETNKYHESSSYDHRHFIDNRLEELRKSFTSQASQPESSQLSQKVIALIQYLTTEYSESVRIIVFVERRTTAWALCHLLQALPSLKHYGIFTYVGSSRDRPTSLYESLSTKTQDAAFLGFKDGSRNLCIATSVAEEGIDVQAVNIVIRYDDPKQVISYLQSRGRARQKDSQIVCFQDTNAEPGKYEEWDRLEKLMEEQYQNDERLLIEQIASEDCDQNEEHEDYTIENSNARLNLNVSVSRLNHFCAKFAKSETPTYVFDGELGVSISARIVLPSCIPPLIRQATSCRTWKSEKMAKRDAAFHAVKALHLAGLINEHLVPFEDETEFDLLIHEKKSREVCAEIPIWQGVSAGQTSFAYRIEVSHKSERYLSLIMILSTPLQQKLCFTLTESVQCNLEVMIVPLGKVDVTNIPSTEEITRSLFEAAFQDGSATGSLHDASRISCLLVPELADSQLEESRIPLSDFLHQQNWLLGLQPLLVWTARRPRPYVWYPPHIPKLDADGQHIINVRQVRKLQIYCQTLSTTVNIDTAPASKNFQLANCEARGITSIYGPTVLLLPSILHLMAAAIRAQHASETILQSIDFSSTEHLVPALLAKSASGTFNYERLEFLGDSCLKYLTSVQMFFDNPLAPEGILTRKTHEIIGNTRLEKAINEVGLVPFITTEIPSQKHWKLPIIRDASELQGTRNVLSKTLADVVESVLGAAYLDGQQSDEQTAEHKCLSALRLFIPEIDWLAPEEHIEQTFYNNNDSHQHPASPHQSISTTSTTITPSILQPPIREMLGYQFQNPASLIEALTHSTDMTWQPTLDRLEFLGDAILDQIIKTTLFNNYPSLDAGRLTICRHALAGHVLLSYCALGMHYVQTRRDVKVSAAATGPKEQRNRKAPPVVHETSTSETVYLTDLIKFRDAAPWRKTITKARMNYERVKSGIEVELGSSKSSTGKKTFPWTLLRGIDAPKICSDVIESLLAAVFLDSCGSLEACTLVLERLGVMSLLHRMAADAEFEARTPGAILRELCAEKGIIVVILSRNEEVQRQQQKQVRKHRDDGDGEMIMEMDMEVEAKTKKIVGEVRLDGNVSIVRQASCVEEAKSLVAEAAIEFLLSLQGQGCDQDAPRPGSSADRGCESSSLDIEMSGMN